MMKWVEQKPVITGSHQFLYRDDTQHVSVANKLSKNGKRWLYYSMSFGEFSTESAESCLRSWPREAIRQAREALDNLEAELDGEQEDGQQQELVARPVADDRTGT